MSLSSLISTGTKVWLDAIDPDTIQKQGAWGATGAASNSATVAKIVSQGQFDCRIGELIAYGLADDEIAFELEDEFVRSAQKVFLPVWQKRRGNDGYVSFELDPLIEDDVAGLTHAQRVKRYVELGRKWSEGHKNRMIQVPASETGLEALEALAFAGVTINVTLIFTERQYRIARDAIWRGVQRRVHGLNNFKSVYSVFASRVDAYTENRVPILSDDAQGMAGIVNAKWIWRDNHQFWKDKGLRLHQEIAFASTGVRKPNITSDKYVEAFAGGDIQTNSPATNQAVEESKKIYTRQIHRMPPQNMLGEIDSKINKLEMERILLAEGIRKSAEAQKMLLGLIAHRRILQAAGERSQLLAVRRAGKERHELTSFAVVGTRRGQTRFGGYPG